MAAQFSTKPWSSVSKSQLPRACFLWIEGDGETKDQWHLPVYEGTGGIDPKTNMYRKRGMLNKNGVAAAYAAIKGARQGTPMSIPNHVRSTIMSLRKRCGFDDEA